MYPIFIVYNPITLFNHPLHPPPPFPLTSPASLRLIIKPELERWSVYTVDFRKVFLFLNILPISSPFPVCISLMLAFLPTSGKKNN